MKQIKTQIEENVEVLNDISFMYLDTDLNPDEMKQLSFQLKSQHKNTVLLLTSLSNNKPLISLMISEDLVESRDWNAGQFIRILSN